MGKASEEKEKNIKTIIELNEELENYFRNTVIPQLFVDADLILRKFTPPAMKHFNLSNEDLGRHISDVSNNIRYPTIEENIREVIESKQDLEKEIQTADFKWYQMNILPYLIQKGNKANGVIITFVDITGRIESIKRYEKLNRNYENIFYSVAHDFKGPLSSIDVLIKMLKDVPEHKKEDSKTIIKMVGLSVQYLLKAVEEITDFNMKINGSTEVEEKANFEHIAEDVQLALKDKMYETDARVTTEFNVSEVEFSRKDIRSIFYNLLSNAIKYKAPDHSPEIIIKTEKLKDYILLSFKDNGLGIAEDKHEMIFSRHTRISNDVEGTGVGLFIVKRMVEDGGGRIELESSLGEGSTFKVYLKN